MKRLLFTFLFLLSTFTYSSLGFSKEIKVLTYNVWGLPFPIAKRLKRLELIQKKLPKFEADIIGLQEVFTKKASRILRQKNYPYKVLGPKKSKLKFNSGLALLSKFPIISSKTIKYNDCKGWDCRASKGVLFAKIDLGEQTIDVYVTHLNAEGRDSGPRLNQINQLLRFVEQNSAGEKVLFLGDLNFTDDSFLHLMIKGRLGLVDTHQEFVEKNPHLPQEVLSGFTSSHNERIDYIWSSRDFVTHKSTVIFKEKLYKGKQLSDHKAVLTHLEL